MHSKNSSRLRDQTAQAPNWSGSTKYPRITALSPSHFRVLELGIYVMTVLCCACQVQHLFILRVTEHFCIPSERGTTDHTQVSIQEFPCIAGILHLLHHDHHHHHHDHHHHHHHHVLAKKMLRTYNC